MMTREEFVESLASLEEAATRCSDLVMVYRDQVLTAYDAQAVRLTELEAQCDELLAAYKAALVALDKTSS